MLGLPELRGRVAAHYRHFQGLDLDPETRGDGHLRRDRGDRRGLLALIEPGDEVVLFQPLYDAYLPLVRRAGGVPRFVRLAPPDWRIDRSGARRGLHAEDERVVLFNNPLNPTATLFGADELALLADFCVDASTRSRSATRSGSMSSSTAARHMPADGAARACASGRSRSARPAKSSR